MKLRTSLKHGKMLAPVLGRVTSFLIKGKVEAYSIQRTEVCPLNGLPCIAELDLPQDIGDLDLQA